MSTRLVILGFLRNAALYGYQIKRMIEQVMGDWTSIAFGSIYFALRKLAEDGYVEKVGTEQEGSRPSRTIYQITAAGREEFLRLLREVWSNVERQYFTFDIGLTFIGALEPDEVKGYLRRRVEYLQQTLEYLEHHKAETMADEHVPQLLASAVFDHSRVHYQAELEWTRALLKSAEEGELEAEMGWMRRGLEEMGRHFA
jgi:DNA-binding PadR family transcriptional regulator